MIPKMERKSFTMATATLRCSTCLENQPQTNFDAGRLNCRTCVARPAETMDARFERMEKIMAGLLDRLAIADKALQSRVEESKAVKVEYRSLPPVVAVDGSHPLDDYRTHPVYSITNQSHLLIHLKGRMTLPPGEVEEAPYTIDPTTGEWRWSESSVRPVLQPSTNPEAKDVFIESSIRTRGLSQAGTERVVMQLYHDDSKAERMYDTFEAWWIPVGFFKEAKWPQYRGNADGKVYYSVVEMQTSPTPLKCLVTGTTPEAITELLTKLRACQTSVKSCYSPVASMELVTEGYHDCIAIGVPGVSEHATSAEQAKTYEAMFDLRKTLNERYPKLGMAWYVLTNEERPNRTPHYRFCSHGFASLTEASPVSSARMLLAPLQELRSQLLTKAIKDTPALV